jgi:hypothetical protein
MLSIACTSFSFGTTKLVFIDCMHDYAAGCVMMGFYWNKVDRKLKGQ